MADLIDETAKVFVGCRENLPSLMAVAKALMKRWRCDGERDVRKRSSASPVEEQ